MLNKLGFILLFFLCSKVALTQESFEYVGAINLNDTILIPYKVKFFENKGSVSGYSITDIGGNHETQSNIFGEYDRKEKELNFRETNIVYTKSPITQKDFCFLNVTVKKFQLDKTKNFKTKFVGLFSDNTKCIDGEILMNSSERLQDRMERLNKKINKSKRIPDSIKQKLNLRKLMDSLSMNVLKKDETLSLFAKSDKIKLTLYDGGKEDGDKIAITVNGKYMLSNYEAKNEKKIVLINIVDSITSVKIKALNEGLIAPNTVVVEIEDGKNSIKALSNLKKGETTQVHILRVLEK